MIFIRHWDQIYLPALVDRFENINLAISYLEIYKIKNKRDQVFMKHHHILIKKIQNLLI